MQEIEVEAQALARTKRNVQAAIAEYGPSQLIREKLVEIEKSEAALSYKRSLFSQPDREPALPKSTTELRTAMEAEFQRLAVSSYDFADLMRTLVPNFSVHLVRLCDSRRLLPRAKVRLNLAGSFPDVERLSGAEAMMSRELTINLFDPPQRELIRPEVIRFASAGLRQRDMASRLQGYPTQAAISRAFRLHQRMLELGLEDPYIIVLEPPNDRRKLRRHQHPRFRFEPLNGFEPLL